MNVYDTLNELLDVPCKQKFKDKSINPEEIMKESKWCEKFCGIVDGGRCWYKFFSLLEKRKGE